MILPPSHRILAAAIRTDFLTFLRKVFAEICPGEPFLMNWHIDTICHEIELAIAGPDHRLIINMPPRSLKSIIVSVALPAWLLGHDPAMRIICVSYTDDLARKFARDFNRVVAAAWYRKVFPATAAKPGKISESEFVTGKNGFRLATSIGGTLTGRGGHVIIIDDPMKANDAESETERNRTNSWFNNTASSRLDNQATGIIIVAMQRLHQNDLTGHLLSSPGFRQLSLPAIAFEETVYALGNGRLHTRKPGDFLHPERNPPAIVERLRAEIGSRDFAAQYQQDPVPAEGALFRLSWLRYVERQTDATGFERIVQSWDIASKVGAANDYSVGTTWGISGQTATLLDVQRVQMEIPDLLRLIEMTATIWRPQCVLIEDANTGSAVIQLLRKYTQLSIIDIRPKMDKFVRASQATAAFESGRILVPRDAPWLAEFLSELLGFPNTRHDDQVDSTTQFINWWTDQGGTSLPDFELVSFTRVSPWRID